MGDTSVHVRDELVDSYFQIISTVVQIYMWLKTGHQSSLKGSILQVDSIFEDVDLHNIYVDFQDDKRRKKTDLTSSTKFFKKLQDEVTTHVKSRNAESRKKSEKVKSSTKLKL